MDTLDGLLQRGEVTLLETLADGKLKEATAIGIVRRPIDDVYAKLADFGAYENWMPQVDDSTVVSRDGNTMIVDISIGVVGPNVNFRQRVDLDPVAHRIEASWVSGALEGSHWTWELQPHAEGTLAYRRLHAKVIDGNWVLRQVEDENHTLEYGINTATGIIEIRGLKKALGVR